MDTCKRVRAHLNDFLDGTLGAEHAQELNAHLLDCGECRGEYRALKATQELIRQAPVADGSAAQKRVMARFRQAVASSPPRLPSLLCHRASFSQYGARFPLGRQ